MKLQTAPLFIYIDVSLQSSYDDSKIFAQYYVTKTIGAKNDIIKKRNNSYKISLDANMRKFNTNLPTVRNYGCQ